MTAAPSAVPKITSERERGLVLDLWDQGKSSTYCIAQALDLPEEEVCHIIDQARSRSARACGRRAQ